MTTAIRASELARMRRVALTTGLVLLAAAAVWFATPVFASVS